MTNINVAPAGRQHSDRFLDAFFESDRSKRERTEDARSAEHRWFPFELLRTGGKGTKLSILARQPDPVSSDEFLDRMVSLRRLGGKPGIWQRWRLERMETDVLMRFEEDGDLEGLLRVREALGRPVCEAEIRSRQEQRADRVRCEALDKVTSWHTMIARAARSDSIDERCLHLRDQVDALMRQARAKNIELQAEVHEMAGSIHDHASARRMTPKPKGLQDSIRKNLTKAIELLRLGNPYQADSVLLALERVDSDLARAKQVEFDPDVARHVSRLVEYRGAAQAMREYADTFDHDLEELVEWRTWIAADDD